MPERWNSGATEMAVARCGSIDTLSPWQRWCHATIGELWEAVLIWSLVPGGQCHYNGTCDTSTTSTEEQYFLLGPCRGYIWRIKTLERLVRVKSLKRVCRQTDQFEQSLSLEAGSPRQSESRVQREFAGRQTSINTVLGQRQAVWDGPNPREYPWWRTGSPILVIA
jgi:hypothetical protein